MATVRTIVLLLSLTACAISGLQGLAEGQAHSTLNGFPDLSDIQRDAAQLHRSIVRFAHTILFPTLTFTCTGRVTNLTFMAIMADTVLIIGPRNPQLLIWRTDDVGYRRVSPEIRITIDKLTELSPFMFTFSPESMEFSDGDYLGLYQPSSSQRTMDLFLQLGGGPENVYVESPDLVSSLLFSEITTNDRNDHDYPLVSIQTDPPGCAKGFLTTEALKRFIDEYLIISYERQQLIIPSIEFTCDATLNNWTVAGQIGPGSMNPEIQVWKRTCTGLCFELSRVRSFPLVGSDLQPRSNQKNMYDVIPNDTVTISSGNVLGLYQPALAQSSFVVFYKSESGPQIFGKRNRDSPADNFTIFFNSRGNNYPLVTVDVTPADCASGFISSEALAEQALLLADFVDVYGQQRIIPAMNITQDGLLTKWTFAGRSLGTAVERTEYPELHILRLNSGDTYDIVHKTESNEQPSMTGFLNVYEYIPNLPLRVRAGDILGFRQPPETSSKLLLAVTEGAGPPNEILEPISKKRLTNVANGLPLILVDIAMLQPSPTAMLPPSPTIDPREREDPSIPVAAIAGASIGALVVIGVLAAIAVIIPVCVSRKKGKENRRDRHTMSSEEREVRATTAYIPTESTILSTRDHTYESVEDIAVDREAHQYDNATPTEQEEDTVGETIPTEENVAYGNREMEDDHEIRATTAYIPTESTTLSTRDHTYEFVEDIAVDREAHQLDAYANVTPTEQEDTVGETIPTEENVAYGNREMEDDHLQLVA